MEIVAAATAGLRQLDAYADHWDDDSADSFLRRRDKVSAEAVLLAYLAARVPQPTPELTRAIRALCVEAEARIATPRNEAMLRRFPQTAATIGLGYVLLSRMGYPHPTQEALLREAVRHGFHRLRERRAFRIMDVRWTYGEMPGCRLGAPAEMLPHASVGASPHPIYAMNEDAYAITHAVFYCTDFGARASEELQAIEARELLDPFIAWNTVHADLDLLGEFLMAAIALRQPLTPTARFGWDVLMGEWERQGQLLGPEFSRERATALSGVEAEAYAFGENYHTAFVGGMLCALRVTVPPAPTHASTRPVLDGPGLGLRCLQAAEQLTASVPGPTAITVSVPATDRLEWLAGRLLATLGQVHDPPPPWLASVAASDLSRNELEQTLSDALLSVAAREYLLVTLAEALAASAPIASLRTRTFERALDFLLSQQLESALIGVHGLLAVDPGDDYEEAQGRIASHLCAIARALSNAASAPP